MQSFGQGPPETGGNDLLGSQVQEKGTHEQLALLAPALTAIAATTEDRTLTSQVTAALEKAPVDPLRAKNGVAQAAASLPGADAKLTPRVYLTLRRKSNVPSPTSSGVY
jgi:hypothetical protein